MRMMRFRYVIEYTAGKNLVTTDALSRGPVGTPTQRDKVQETELQMHVQSVMDGLPASDGKLTQIREAQDKDEVCSQVKNFCLRF